MAQVKTKKSGVMLDMTAMCDVAFLLLTFFILTAKMKVPDPAKFEVPSSVSEKKLPDENVVRISISNEGAVFLTIAEQSKRKELIKEIDKMYSLGLNENDKEKFSLIETFGVPMKQLKFFLNLSDDKRKLFKQEGIVIDSTNNELKGWVRVAKTLNANAIIAIKGDRDSEYAVFKKVIATMQEMHLNRFSLITGLENKPSAN
ncbi:MAG: biopolymer transporter ExbD [Cytophagaceae bacterium]|nr:biopolymer transporter ExbD [Cytophagaceae bacterium]